MSVKACVALGLVLVGSGCSANSDASGGGDSGSDGDSNNVGGDPPGGDNDSTTSCGAELCAGVMSEDPNAPRITKLEVVGQQDSDPWNLILSVTFSDTNGDLGAGVAELFMDSAPAFNQRIDELFRARGLAMNATAGVVGIAARFSESSTANQTVDLAVQLTDEADLRSNCSSLTLEITVNPI